METILSPIVQPASSATDPAATLLMMLSGETRSPHGAFQATIETRTRGMVWDWVRRHRDLRERRQEKFASAHVTPPMLYPTPTPDPALIAYMYPMTIVALTTVFHQSIRRVTMRMKPPDKDC